MGQPSTEPSMEDILASIKRIIAEDGEQGHAPPPPRGTQRVRRGPVAVPDIAPDVAGRDETSADDPEAGEARREESVVDAPPPPEVADEATAPEAATPVMADEAPEPQIDRAPSPAQEFADVLELTSPLPDERDPILSGAAEQASSSAFAALSQLQVRAEGGQPNTLEGLVADLLKPMLREYLDRELPGIVERLVSAEVKRVSGRG